MPRKTRDPYRGISARMEAGEEPQLIEPLDYLLLDELPLAGTLAAGLYPLGSTVIDLINGKFKALPRASQVITNRLRSLQAWGLTTHIPALGSTSVKAWQKTERGKEVLEAWKSRQVPTQ